MTTHSGTEAISSAARPDGTSVSPRNSRLNAAAIVSALTRMAST
jgi:hypothetical protein